jgi:DNA-binding GntR family transcriptional regulator
MPKHRKEDAQLSLVAYETMRDGILSLQIRPGSSLVERDLAAELSMSVTPVREALHRLEHEGLVTKLPYKGCRVSEICMEDVEEIYELRELLEGRCARIAASELPEDDIQRMTVLLNEARDHIDKGDQVAGGEVIWEFHDLIMKPVENCRLKDFLTQIRAQARRIGTITTHIPGRQEKSLLEHAAIVEALVSRNPNAAEQAMIAHIQSLLHDLRQDYERGGLSVAFLASAGLGSSVAGGQG